MVQPRITVVTPSLNQGRYIERTLCSVLDQGYANLEYFVLDGGSTDNTLDILKLYDRDLDAWVSQPDGGQADAANQGLLNASGDIVCVLNSDDVLLPGTLHEVADRMLGKRVQSSKCKVQNGRATSGGGGGVRWVVGNCVRIGASDQMLGTVEAAGPRDLASFLMHNSGVIPLAATFWRRDLIAEYGLFDADLHHAFDYEYWCRLLANGEKPTMIPQTLAAQREHPAAKSATATLARGMEYIRAAERYADHLHLSDRAALSANLDRRRRILALAEAETRGEEARQFLWQQVMKHPGWITHPPVRQALVHGVSRGAAVRPAA